MNDQQNLPGEPHDDSLERSLLGSLESDTAPPDRAAIDRALAVASEAFHQQSQKRSAVERTKPDSEKETRRGGMFTKALMGMSAIAAAVMMFFQAGAPADRETLGSMLDKTLEAKSLKLSVDRDGKKSDVLVSLASHVRWEESETKYRIASSKESWEIDTKGGDPKPTEIAWHDQDTGKVDMLALLGVDVKQSKAWRNLVASEPESIDGKKRYVFTSKAGQPVLHAYFSAASDELLEVCCWPNGWNANVQPARLLVVARDVVVDESTFVVAKKLSDDGRIGKITDSQGIVTLRPKMNKRWTPVVRHMLLKPGDWVRTDARGANAATLVTASAYKVIVGPASLVETISDNEIRLHRGEINVVGSKSAKEELTIRSPGDGSVSVGKGKAVHYLANDQRELEVVSRKPLWLAGYQGKTIVDTTGSLLANIDGRETPLTIGYHKVHVEIRDQIARTTIEQSFVNHTARRLEGIFHFPLPQDASISGFGMWIDGELVEADVVEKQRAREIFETILREKRDPGLLEWTGGNIFKARVFPIEPSREKRIKIVYTQVLPLTGSKFRYAYGLRSEMLQTTPLRELELDVQVHSSLPIQSIGSSTHAVRTIQTGHSAKLEFEAQEYTPQRDFEVVCELDGTEKNLVVVPHRRGKDGYFLAQFALPDQGGWKRQTIADSEALDVLIVCDTSASMDSVKRADQQKFVSSLLSGLGENDRFDIAFCDVSCGWQNNELVPASEENAGLAIDWIEERASLGWTDLDAMLAAVLARARKATQVVYVGDGIVSNVDADPQAFLNRLQRATRKAKGDFHAVSVGNSFETVVLNSLGGIGTGSVRGVSGEQTPQRVALDLLTEISNPRLTDLKLEFEGVDVAAVYPQRLPNLAAGKQQIFAGRYLPNGKDQKGKLVVTGKLAGKSVKYSTPITFADAESGNSFIPRLWARGHLDHLLSQGSGPLVRDQVIALSEEFHIMTPYTSLLVLESDADRERFGVKRRMEIRDGEQFFADGRKKSNYELLQKQMKEAGDWRLALRRSVLLDLSSLGRDPALFSEAAETFFAGTTFEGYAGGGGGFGGGGSWGGIGISGEMNSSRWIVDEIESKTEIMDGLSLRVSASTSLLDAKDEMQDLDEIEGLEYAQQSIDASGMALSFESSSIFAAREQQQFVDFNGGFSGERRSGRKQAFMRKRLNGPRPTSRPVSNAMVSGAMMWNGPPPALSLSHLFASSYAPSQSTLNGELKGDARAIELLKSLQQPTQFDAGGIEGIRHSKSFDLDWGRVTEATTRNWIAQERWAYESSLEKHWFDQKTRSAHHKAFETILKRPCSWKASAPTTDLERPFATERELAGYYNREATIVDEKDDTVILQLSYAANTKVHTRVTIDRKRKLVISVAHFNDWNKEGDLPNQVVNYDEHKEIAGVWWPTKIEHKNRDGKTTKLVIQDVRGLSKAKFAAAFRAFLPNEKRFFVLSEPSPSDRDSHIAILQGKAGLEHHYVLLHDDCAVQDWERASKHVEAMENLASGKSAMNWIRFAFLKLAVRHADASALVDQIADTLLKKNEHGQFLANYLSVQVSGVLDANETLRLLDKLKPIYEGDDDGLIAWRRSQIQQLRSLGDPRTIQLQKQLASDVPWDQSMQTLFAQDLKNSGDLDAAIAWLQKQIDDYPGDRSQWSFQSYNDQVVRILRDAGRSKQLVTFCEQRWTDNPEHRASVDSYLNALVFDERSDDSDRLALEWMKAAQVDEALDKATETKLMAGISYALGHRSPHHLNWIHPKWYEPLAEVARFFLESEHHPNVSQQVISNYRFKDCREADELFADIAKRVRKGADKMSPKLLQQYLAWIVPQNMLNEKQSKRVAKIIRGRWDAAGESGERTSLGSALITVLGGPHQMDELYPFLRWRVERALQEGNVSGATTHRNALYARLLSEQTWTQERETEAFALLKRLGEGEKINNPIASYGTSLFQLVDAMHEKRVATAKSDFEATDHPEELTRQQLAREKAQREKDARLGLVATLNQHTDGDDELSEWILLEKLHQQVKAGESLDEVAKECWRIVGEKPAQSASDLEIEKLDTTEQSQLVSKELRQERAIDLLSYLAVRRSSSKRLQAKLLSYLEEGAKVNTSDPTPWRYRQFELLVALDRPEELKTKLLSWIALDSYPVSWQRLLANLHAELGEVIDAIRLTETVKSFVRLTPQESSSLSKWYLVSDKQSAYEDAKLATYAAMPDNVIANWLDRRANELMQSDDAGLTEIDEKVLDAIAALMIKASSPQQHVRRLMNFYERTRDFRLLKTLPEALIGRTAQSVYPTLDSISSRVFPKILKEATLDKIGERIDELHAGNLSTLDARAIDLLETLVERRAAEVINEPGPHIAKAKEAMKRAFDRGNWKPGEIKQMATFLASLNTLSMTELRQERVRQYGELKALTKPSTEVRFFVSWKLAHSIAWSDGNHDAGISEMQVAIDDYKKLHPNGFPKSANRAVFDYVTMLNYRGRFSEAEKFLREQIKTAINSGQRLEYITQLNDTLIHALRDRGQVSLGEGEELYQSLRQSMTKQAANAVEDSERTAVIRSILQLFRVAGERKIKSVEGDLWNFASRKFPAIAAKQTNNHQALIGTVDNRVKQQLGGLKALEFTLIVFEKSPKRWRNGWNSLWNQMGYKFAERLQKHKSILGGLEKRILKVVLAELRFDLIVRQGRSRYCYSRTSGLFWAEKINDFAAEAESVLGEYKESGRHVDFIGRYLYDHLHLHNRAIEIMLDAYKAKTLNISGKSMLAAYLTNKERAKEAVPILKEVIAESPDYLHYRIQMLRAYAATKQLDEWNNTLQSTNQHFRQGTRWSHSVAGNIGQACLNAKQFQLSVDYAKEAIGAFKRNSTQQYNDRYTLSGYYRQLADAHVGLENTAEAVDAISAAMIVWRNDKSQRHSLGYSLQRVLRECDDLTAYIKTVDRQAAKTGMDSPFLRKHLGNVLYSKRKLPEAEAQLRAAIALQPNDAETHKKLIELFELRKDSKSAFDQTLTLIVIEKHNLENYHQLVALAGNDPEIRERAITTIIEAAPNEAEHHQRVAELRQEKKDWEQAIGHWKQVAKLRALEPTGLLGLAKAQIAAKKIGDAKSTLKQVEDTQWDQRFSNAKTEAENLLRSIK